MARVFGFELIAVLFCWLFLLLSVCCVHASCTATGDNVNNLLSFFCVSFPLVSPTLLHCPLRPLGRMRNQHLVMDCRCVTCQAEFAVSLYLSLSLSICLSLSLSLSLVIYLHPVYLGMLWPWFVNLPLAFCMIAWHFRCKTLNRMPLSPALPPSPFSPSLPYTIS